MALQTFDEQLDKMDGEVPSILLGNGFSQAWERNIFNYRNLFQQANFGVRHNSLINAFTHFDTFDFEKIMKKLESAEYICQSYNVPQNYIQNIQADKEQLKSSLIDVITRSHPARSSYVTVNQYDLAKPFISQFEKVFTLNYDLLLYWIINKTEITPRGYQNNDGFFGDTWIARPNQDVFFVHGGLHLYDTGLSIKKHVFNDNLNVSIAEQVSANLNAGNFPLFVSEPTAEKKLSKIKHNPYLNSCFEAIKSLRGSLFIHGHAMAANDQHIFNQIKESDVTRIFVGIFGDENSDENIITIANARRFLQKRSITIEFYDAATAPIWA